MNAIVQHFHFEPGTLIAYDGYEVVVVASVRDGIVVRDRFVGEDETPRQLVLKDELIRELLGRNDVEIDANFTLDLPDPASYLASEPSFELLAPEKRRTAFQREAWCLAARNVLKGPPYTEQRIETLYDRIQMLAHDRQRLNELGTDRSGSFAARDWGAKSVSNYCKAYFGMRSPHARILVDKPRPGNTTRRLSAAEDALLDKCCQSYKNKAQPSGASIVTLVKRRFREVRNERRAKGDLRPFNTPHANTVYRRLSRFSRLELVLGREGYRAAQKEFSPTQHGVRTLKPGELIELDFWKGDVFTFSKQSKFWDVLTPDLQKTLMGENKAGRKKSRQRLWVCVAVDVATRMVLGLGIAEKPNARTVIEVLDMVMRDKSDLSRRADCKMPWSQHVGLGTIIVDTGQEFFNDEVQTAILAAGGSFVYGRAAVPMDKPFVERYFGGLRTLFADELPGKTGYSPQCLIDYDKEGMAAFDADQFRLLLVKYIVECYPLREHTGLIRQRPIDAWKEAQKYGALRPPLPRVRRNATGLKVKRMLSKEGVRICGVPFGDPSLFPRYIRNGKVAVEVRIDPNDLREVTIVLEGKPVHLANQRPDLAHHSIRTLMAAIKEMVTSKPNDRKFYEYVLAEHADWFADKIRTGVQAHGLPSTEVTQDELDWFEHSYCLRLQITANPEKAASADFDALLAGDAGRGIFSAEDIAREKAAAAQMDDATTQQTAGIEGTAETASETDLRSDAAAKEVAPPGPGPSRRTPPGPSETEAADGKPPGKRFVGKPKGKGTFT